ncbi:MAG: FecR domain-containing protein [Elusimicrobia bacterium]|nr:FecR domain-containing protein [Elusimicrobiota bacterium]
MDPADRSFAGYDIPVEGMKPGNAAARLTGVMDQKADSIKKIGTIKAVVGSLKAESGDRYIRLAKVNDDIFSRERLITDYRSAAGIRTEKGDIVKINADTEVNIRKEDQFYLHKGELFYSIEKNNMFFINTYACSCTALGAEMNIKVAEAGKVRIYVYEGEVRVEHSFGKNMLGRDMSIEVSPDAVVVEKNISEEHGKPGWLKRVDF